MNVLFILKNAKEKFRIIEIIVLFFSVHKGLTKFARPSSSRPTQGPVPTTRETFAKKAAKQEIGWIIGTVVVALLVLLAITGESNSLRTD